MRLESVIDPAEDDSYYPGIRNDEGILESIDLRQLIENIVRDIGKGHEAGRISARFHNTISDLILNTVLEISNDCGIRKVALSGGTFQNRYLSERTENLLKENGIEVLVPLKIPANDGGIALGQLAIAAKKRSLGLV